MRIQIFLILALSLSQVLSRDYDDEEGRPYEFGFTIDGQQHRRESKDVNGIIMGEFGFITADGIYHVTVYATDENGNFKILSMRNVRVSGPLDQPGYEFKKSEKLQQAPPSTTTTTTTTTQAPTTNFKAPYSFTTLPSLNVAACSSCRLPSTTPRPPGAPNKFPFQTPAFQDKKPVVSNIPAVVSNKPSVGVPNYPSVASPFGLNNPPVLSQNVPVVPQNIPYNLPPDVELISQNPSAGNGPEFDDLGAGVLQPRFEPKLPISTPSIEQQPPFQNPGNNLIPTHEELQSPVNPEIQNFVPDQTPKPTNINIPKTPQITVANKQINIPGKNPIPIKDTYPNMVDGLPEGITENDMLDLLYKFNYTLGFHGHHERGLKNGAKIGAYFVNGRDGIMRIVEYVADENGYRPKVKFINLGLDSPDTPKEGSEKKFGLKGFEFVWYPV